MQIRTRSERRAVTLFSYETKALVFMVEFTRHRAWKVIVDAMLLVECYYSTDCDKLATHETRTRCDQFIQNIRRLTCWIGVGGNDRRAHDDRQRCREGGTVLRGPKQQDCGDCKTNECCFGAFVLDCLGKVVLLKVFT